eukprot:12401080-Karenia_brevis.AAC.1
MPHAPSTNLKSRRSPSGISCRVRPYDRAGLKSARSALCVPRSLTQLLMVEVFAGSGSLAKAFARKGFQVLMWDIAYGDQYDLKKPSNQKALRRILGSAHYVHFAPPCLSFSLARRGRAPRSRQYPFGKPWLSDIDQLKVDEGNILLAFCVS